MKDYAILKSRVGDVSIRSTGEQGQEKIYVWNEKNGWTVSIPVSIVYTNEWGKQVLRENFAQDMLNSHKDTNRSSKTFGESIFELVEVETKTQVETKKDELKQTIKKIKKEKKDEEVV